MVQSMPAGSIRWRSTSQSCSERSSPRTIPPASTNSPSACSTFNPTGSPPQNPSNGSSTKPISPTFSPNFPSPSRLRPDRDKYVSELLNWRTKLLDREAPAAGVPEGPGGVRLQRAESSPTPDQALWVAIRNRTRATSFDRYQLFINRWLREFEDFVATIVRH